jgi:hypothetical protein
LRLYTFNQFTLIFPLPWPFEGRSVKVYRGKSMLLRRERGVNHKKDDVSIGKVRKGVGEERLNVRGRRGRKVGRIVCDSFL